MHVLILSCSQTKLHTPGLLPAWQRYDGPAWRVLRGYYRERPDLHPETGVARAALRVLVLSAEHGLIQATTPIQDYDRKMDKARAVELSRVGIGTPARRPEHLEPLLLTNGGNVPEEVLVWGGALYRGVFRHWVQAGLMYQWGTRYLESAGGIGVQLRQLHRWLRGQDPNGPELDLHRT